MEKILVLEKQITKDTNKLIETYVRAEAYDSSEDKVEKLAKLKAYCVEWVGIEGFNEIYQSEKIKQRSKNMKIFEKG